MANKPLTEENPSELFAACNCPVCGSGDYTVRRPAKYTGTISRADLVSLYSASSHSGLLDQVVACKSCETVYLNPRPTPEIIVSSYEGAVDPTFVRQNPSRIRTFKRAMEKIQRRHGVSPASHPRVLDVGCAGGAFLKAATDLGYRATGVEPSRWMVENARKEFGVDARPGILSDHKFSPGEFDIISLWDVLEHLPNPTQTLGEIHQLLRPGGVLIVNYPDIGSLTARLMGYRWPFWLSVHLTYYTRATIRRQLANCRFAVLGIEPYFQSLELGYTLERASVIFAPFGIFRAPVRWLGLDSSPFRYNMGQTLVVAQKAS